MKKHNQTVPNCSKIEAPKDIFLVEEWKKAIEWHVIPKGLRGGFSVPRNVKGFAQHLSISPTTLSTWRNREDFWDEVNKRRKIFINPEWISEMLYAMYKQGLKDGDPKKVRLMLIFCGDKSMHEQPVKYEIPVEIRSQVKETLEKVNRRITN